MAIYHFSAQIISRSSGRSATAAAAYRAGEKIVDRRTGEIYDYTRKTGVDSSWILATNSAPDWVKNREELWNRVEAVEQRKDSQLAREINVALPTELDKTQQLELVREFANEQFISQGMVADIACHDLDSHNPHAHIMLTMREIDEQGFSLKKNRDWNRKELLEKQRQAWANHTNKALERAGVNQTIDHRSYEAQGNERIPQIHLGVAVNAMKKRGIVTERVERYHLIESCNRQIRKHEFHLGLIDRLESNYRNNPEIESDTPIQFQTIKPPQIKSTANPVVHDTSEQPTKPEPANELQGLEQTITRFQREADYFAKRLEQLKANTEETVYSQSERESERPEYEPEKKAISDEVSKPVSNKQYRQVIEIAVHFMKRLKSEVWDCSLFADDYDVKTNGKDLLVIEAKDGRGEILRFQDGKINQLERLTVKDLEIFQEIYINSKYQHQIAHTASRFLHITGRQTWGEEQNSQNYNLSNKKGILTIEAKDGRGEILRRQEDGKIVAQGLTLIDVERFQKINNAIDLKLEQVKSRQRNQSRGFER